MVVAEQRDDSPGRGQLNAHHEQQKYDRHDRAVEEQQHRDDDDEGDDGDLHYGAITGVGHIGLKRRRTGHKDLDAGRRRRLVHNGADRFDRLDGQRLTHVSGEIELHVRGLAVVALRSGLGEWITPEILDVLDVRVVGPQLLDQAVVVVVRVLPERLVTLQDEHRDAVGIGFPEQAAHGRHRLHRRRIRRAHRHLVLRGHLLQLGHGGIQEEQQSHPAENDGYRHAPDPLGEERRLPPRLQFAHAPAFAHADFTKQ